MEEIINMLTRMTFLTGPIEGDYYQENIGGVVTRWFDTNGNVVELPLDCSYTTSKASQDIPSWYVDPTAQ